MAKPARAWERQPPPMDFIRIEQLELECIVGVRPRERHRKQPVRLDVVLGLDLSHAARTGRITLTADYDRVATEATTLLRFREYQLIEAATEELSAMLFGLHPPLESVELTLEKPAALRGVARGASVKVARRRSDFPRRRVPTAFGELEILLETHEAGLYLVHVEPGRELPRRAVAHRELEWAVSGELSPPVGAHGAPVIWAEGRARGSLNSGAARVTVFSCVSPPLTGAELSGVVS